MKLDGVQVIAADRMTVWRALNNPDVLQASIPGCKEMTQTSPTNFEAVVVQKIGPVKATFNGAVELQDVIEGQSLTLAGEGKGGVAGMAKGSARVTLTDVAGGTQLSYDADASVAGRIAQLGSRLIDGVANKMANSFFENFKGQIEGQSGAAPAGSASAATAASIGGNTPDDVWATAKDVASLGGVAAAGSAVAASVGSTASSAASAATGAVSGVAGGIGNAASGAVDGVTGAVGGAVSGAQDAVAGVAGGIGNAASGAVDGVTGAAGGAMDAAGSAASGTADAAGDAASWAKGAAVAAAGGVAALASRAGDKIDDVHDVAKERVIASGKDIDEAKEWSDAKTHAGAAVDDAGDAVGDAWDAAKAKAAGMSDVAAREWGEAKENASDAVSSAGMAASSAYSAAKGEAADIAQNPRMGPKGRPWYFWIILALIAAVILWLIFG